jgi:hypothetical protein
MPYLANIEWTWKYFNQTITSDTMFQPTFKRKTKKTFYKVKRRIG